MRVWTGLSRQCEHGNNPSSSIKGKEFPDKLFKNLMEQNLSSESSSWLTGRKNFQPNMEPEGFFKHTFKSLYNSHLTCKYVSGD